MNVTSNSTTSSPTARPRRVGPRWVGALALAAAASLLPVTAVHAAVKPVENGQSRATSTQTAAANKALVLTFVDQLFNKADLSVIDRDTDGYVQHNPSVADGPEGLRQLVVFLHGLFPDSHTSVQRVIAQGDLVLLQDKVVSVPGTAGQSIIDIYRVDGGKIVEHWDNLSPVLTTTASGHDQFSTLTSPQINTPDSSALTRLNGRIATRYIRSLSHPEHWRGDRYLADNLVQHDPAITDGATATRAYYANLLAGHPRATWTVARVVAEGDLVAVHSHVQLEPTDLGQSVVDIFRIQGGKIVEHWYGAQDVPATAANANTMF